MSSVIDLKIPSKRIQGCKEALAVVMFNLEEGRERYPELYKSLGNASYFDYRLKTSSGSLKLDISVIGPGIRNTREEGPASDEVVKSVKEAMVEEIDHEIEMFDNDRENTDLDEPMTNREYWEEIVKNACDDDNWTGWSWNTPGEFEFEDLRVLKRAIQQSLTESTMDLHNAMKILRENGVRVSRR